MRSACLALSLLLVACGGGKKEDDASDDTIDDTVPDEGDASDVDEEEALPGLWLEVGDVVDLDGADGLFQVELRAPAEGGEYVIIAFATHWELGAIYEYTASVEGGSGGSGGSLARERAPVGLPPMDDFQHHVEHDWAELIEELEGRAFPQWDTYPPDDPPTVDEVRTFQIRNGSGVVVDIDAQCQIVNEEIAIWFDITSTPTPTVAEMDEIVRLFADIVMPRERIFFGQESDYNEDGVMHVLFSPIVNEDGAVAYFYPCDLMEDPDSMLGCRYGNHAEMIYVTPPELLDERMGSPMALNETMAHETAHMIYFYRKFLLNDQPEAAENIYLNEALAAMAQDVTGMTGGNFFVARGGLDGIETFRVIDILTPGGGYASGERDGALRGQSYLFLRYLFDQAGGETTQTDGTFVDDGGIAWLNTYVDSADLGADNIETMMGGRDDMEIVFDWLTCLAMSNRGPDSAPISDDPAYNYLPTQEDPLTGRTRGIDMFGTFRDMFSLVGPMMASVALNDGEVYATGVQYLTFPASDLVDVTFDIDPTAIAWVRLARLE